MQTRQQERAAAAYTRVNAMLGQAKQKDYGRLCLHLPALIHQCGLCQTVAFLQAKAKDKTESAHFRVLEDLAGVMKTLDLPKAARNGQLGEYLQLSREAMRAAEWMKRYAEAVLKVELGDDAHV